MTTRLIHDKRPHTQWHLQFNNGQCILFIAIVRVCAKLHTLWDVYRVTIHTT